MESNKYGVNIEFKIKYEGDLKELGVILSKGLSIPEFWYDTMEEPPHRLIGFCEVFGFEIEIKNEKNDPSTYLFIAVTTGSFDEIANGRMHDVSAWFACYISFVCKLETTMR